MQFTIKVIFAPTSYAKMSDSDKRRIQSWLSLYPMLVFHTNILYPRTPCYYSHKLPLSQYPMLLFPQTPFIPIPHVIIPTNSFYPYTPCYYSHQLPLSLYPMLLFPRTPFNMNPFITDTVSSFNVLIFPSLTCSKENYLKLMKANIHVLFLGFSTRHCKSNIKSIFVLRATITGLILFNYN